MRHDGKVHGTMISHSLTLAYLMGVLFEMDFRTYLTEYAGVHMICVRSLHLFGKVSLSVS
jgi:hypothetical protein